MADPIDTLLAEHREIMEEVEDLRRAVLELGDRGEAAIERTLPSLQAVARMMATRLLRHARKEDEALFPAVEAIFGTEGTPTAVMRQEHVDIHAEAARFRQTLHELNAVEHPAIVAHGAELGKLATGSGSAEQLRATGAEILRLLDTHFGKEEQILFPMARQVLDTEALERVMQKMEEIEATA